MEERYIVGMLPKEFSQDPESAKEMIRKNKGK